MSLIVVLFAALFLAPAAAYARLYQWLDPASGIVHMSGAPPAWYRTGRPGPTVEVFENGRLVDDTAIHLTAAQDAAMRQEAENDLETRRQAQALRRLREAAQREQAAKAAAKQEAALAAAKEEQAKRAATARQEAAAKRQGAAASASATTPELTEAQVKRLKSLLSEYDERMAAGAAGGGGVVPGQ